MNSVLYILLEELVLKGPRALGFFHSKPVSDICASLTSVSSSHWLGHPSECQEYIFEYIYSYCVLFTFLLKLWAMGYSITIILSGVKNVLLICTTRTNLLYNRLSDRSHSIESPDSKQ